ncbi:hypothetical protein ANAEL_01841 [Anaerolineales bacterium]|nr:hypothetical protein ANAEL_01841 [Anaerolineales bacterium]
MKRNLSRRDFLKFAGMGLGAMALRPFNLETLYLPKPLPQFPNSEIIGRILGMTDIMSRSSNDPLQASSVGVLYDDNLVEWGREVVGNAVGRTNQRFLETSQGYIWAPLVQPTRNLPNVSITAMPAGASGFWAEVTVPYIDLALEGPVVSSWLQSLISYNFPPRLYYGQVVWIDQVRADTNGVVYYRWNESPGHGYGPGDIFWADGAGLKILTDEDVAPISPEVEPNVKTIRVDLTYQTLGCFEGLNEVYFCRISSGAEFNTGGEPVDNWKTPTGDLNTHWKIFSLNMSGGGSAAGYSTPAVPWVTMISGEGIAIHGAFWHNDFGERRSHGCINLKPEDAKWVFRWTTPHISLAQSEQRMTWPDHGTVASVTQLEV